MFILFICCCGCLTFDYVWQGESPGSRNRSASCSWPLPEICLHHERDDIEGDGDDDGDGENDGGDEGEVDNCLKDSDEKPDGGDPPGPHPQSSHLTHPCVMQTVKKCVRLCFSSNVQIFCYSRHLN